jgi:hypothetical protein
MKPRNQKEVGRGNEGTKERRRKKKKQRKKQGTRNKNQEPSGRQLTPSVSSTHALNQSGKTALKNQTQTQTSPCPPKKKKNARHRCNDKKKKQHSV